MAPKPPYQPSLLRLLHGGTALVVIAMWLNGLVIYGHYDGRGFNLPWPNAIDLFSIHEALATLLLPVASGLILYSFTIGNWRLRHPANAAMLLILALPSLSGLGMHRRWLVEKQLDHWVYHLHLLGWILLALGLGWHLLGALSRGGSGLIGSMLEVRLRANDRPLDWPAQVTTWLKHRH
ncbi:MAG: hypothetical protein QM522_10900 [Chitinophagaceae bacterium]|jgi:hypothetical protein|nr:hypothetical protein [Chitinophagaceae bacterium]